MILTIKKGMDKYDKLIAKARKIKHNHSLQMESMMKQRRDKFAMKIGSK